MEKFSAAVTLLRLWKFVEEKYFLTDIYVWFQTTFTVRILLHRGAPATIIGTSREASSWRGP